MIFGSDLLKISNHEFFCHFYSKIRPVNVGEAEMRKFVSKQFGQRVEKVELSIFDEKCFDDIFL